MEEKIMYLLDKLMELEEKLKDAEVWKGIFSDRVSDQRKEIEELNKVITELELKIQDLENEETKVFDDEEA